jgi:hypothetical protein
LKENYPAPWKEIFVFSAMRLFHSSPLKNVSNYYNSSHLSDAFPNAKVSPKSEAGVKKAVIIGDKGFFF